MVTGSFEGVLIYFDYFWIYSLGVAYETNKTAKVQHYTVVIKFVGNRSK